MAAGTVKKSSHGLGVVAAGRNGHRRDGRGDRRSGQNDGRGQSRLWDLRRGNSTSDGWSRAPARPKAIINSSLRRASDSGNSSAHPSGDAARRRQDSQRRRVARRRRGRRGWSSGHDGTDHDGVSTPPPQPGRQSTVATEADTRATIFPKEAERLSIPIRGLCARKSRKSEEVKGNAPKTVRSGWGTIPLKPTPRVGEERVRRPQAQMREIPPSSTGVRLLDTLRSCFVAGSDERDRKATFPLALPFRSSNV